MKNLYLLISLVFLASCSSDDSHTEAVSENLGCNCRTVWYELVNNEYITTGEFGQYENKDCSTVTPPVFIHVAGNKYYQWQCRSVNQ